MPRKDFGQPLFHVGNHELRRLARLQLRHESLAERRRVGAAINQRLHRLVPVAPKGEVPGASLGDAGVRLLLFVDGAVGILRRRLLLGDIGDEGALDRLEMRRPLGLARRLKSGERLVGIALADIDPGSGELDRGLVRGGPLLGLAEVLVGLGEVPVFEGVEAEENMGDGVVVLALHEALREAARGIEIAGGKVELEGVVENIFVGRVFRKGAPVVKGGAVAVPRSARHMTGEIAAEKRVLLGRFEAAQEPASVCAKGRRLKTEAHGQEADAREGGGPLQKAQAHGSVFRRKHVETCRFRFWIYRRSCDDLIMNAYPTMRAFSGKDTHFSCASSDGVASVDNETE